MKTRVVILGAGKVARQLGKRFQEKGHTVLQVYNRSETKAAKLAHELATSYTIAPGDIRLDADLYLLAVSDGAIVPMANKLLNLLPVDALVVHCSGATPMSVFEDYFGRYGVFYPLQTFSLGRPVDWSKIPFCVAAANTGDLNFLQSLGEELGGQTHLLDDKQRAVLHVAAVFVNNFVNHLYQIGFDILEREQLPSSLLQALIEETAAKVSEIPPQQAQTGPALRGDVATLTRHLDQLENDTSWRKIYQLFSEEIAKKS